MKKSVVITNYKLHDEASDYAGCEYSQGARKFIQRTAKITPKKDGQFVTLWKRNRQGVTVPFSFADDFDFVKIICMKSSKVGHFLFSKEVLLKNGILQDVRKKVPGKRGFRVYPQWDKPKNPQAQNTQKWQIEFFY